MNGSEEEDASHPSYKNKYYDYSMSDDDEGSYGENYDTGSPHTPHVMTPIAQESMNYFNKLKKKRLSYIQCEAQMYDISITRNAKINNIQTNKIVRKSKNELADEITNKKFGSTRTFYDKDKNQHIHSTSNIQK